MYLDNNKLVTTITLCLPSRSKPSRCLVLPLRCHLQQLSLSGNIHLLYYSRWKYATVYSRFDISHEDRKYPVIALANSTTVC